MSPPPSHRGSWVVVLAVLAVTAGLALPLLAGPFPFGPTGSPQPNPIRAAGSDTANLTLDPSSAQIATYVNATGNGFDGDTNLSIVFNGTTLLACAPGTSNATNTTGVLIGCLFQVPTVPAGLYYVNATDGINNASATFMVLPPTLTLPMGGKVGTAATANGSGFNASDAYTVSWNVTTTLCSGTTDSGGNFSCEFTVPNAPNGPHTVSAVAGPTSASTTFNINESFGFSPSSGDVGTVVHLHGSGYNPSVPYNVTWDWIDQVCAGTTGTNGDLACTFAVPYAVYGPHAVTAHEQSFNDTMQFQVNSSLSVSPAAGIVGTSIELTALGLEGGADYSYCLSTSTAPADCIESPSVQTANATGSFPTGTTLAVPSGASVGSYDVLVFQGTTTIVSAPFSVTAAEISVSPTAGPVGAVVTLSGSGFVPGDAYSFCFSAAPGSCAIGAPMFTATSSGDVPSDSALAVPASPGGSYFVDVAQSSVLIADAGFTIVASLSLSPSSGAVGTSVVAVGQGLVATASYTLDWTGYGQLTAGTTNASGSFSYSFKAPATPAGPTLVSAATGPEVGETNFTVEPSVSLTPSSGQVGSAVAVSGSGFAASVSFSADWNGSGFGCGGVTTSSGTLSCGGTVPTVPAGLYPINATDGTNLAGAEFRVVPALSLSVTSGFVGTSVAASGTGFDASGAYNLSWSGQSAPLCQGSSASDGTFSCSFYVPATVGGTHEVTAAGPEHDAFANFTVGASLSLSPGAGTVGTMITAAGAGFAASAGFGVNTSAGTSLCTGVTQSYGGFTCTFPVPSAPGGSFPIAASQGSSEATADFVIDPSVSESASSGPVGSGVTVGASGLAASEALVVDWNLTQVCQGDSSAAGAYTCTFSAPASPMGSYPISVIQGSSVISTTFRITPVASLNVTAGTVGTVVRITATGFPASAAVVVAPEWNLSFDLCPGGATAVNGSYTCAFAVPAGGPVGQTGITIDVGGQSTTLAFTLSASPVSPPSAAAFPWSLVAVAAVVIALLLVLVLFAERRRHRRPHASARSSVSAWEEEPGGDASSPVRAYSSRASESVASGGSIGRPADAANPGAVAAPPPVDPNEDIESMIARLERMSEQLYKKKPSELATSTSDLPIDENQGEGK